MTKAIDKDVDYYVAKVESRLRKRYPKLQFEVERLSDHEVVIYYSPYSEEDEYPIVHRVGSIATDALVDSNIRIWVHPSTP